MPRLFWLHLYLASAQEEEILRYWEETETFKEQLRRSQGRPEFVFYDGPPFATGLPHYGHILAGTIKDVVTRFACSTGHHVERRFGWDCHGLPVEYEIDKKLGGLPCCTCRFSGAKWRLANCDK